MVGEMISTQEDIRRVLYNQITKKIVKITVPTIDPFDTELLNIFSNQQSRCYGSIFNMIQFDPIDELLDGNVFVRLYEEPLPEIIQVLESLGCMNISSELETYDDKWDSGCWLLTFTLPINSFLKDSNPNKNAL